MSFSLAPFTVAAQEEGFTLAKVLRSRLGGPSWNDVRKLISARRVKVGDAICSDEARRLKENERPSNDSRCQSQRVARAARRAADARPAQCMGRGGRGMAMPERGRQFDYAIAPKGNHRAIYRDRRPGVVRGGFPCHTGVLVFETPAITD